MTAVKENRVDSAEYTVHDGTVKGRYWTKKFKKKDESKLKDFTSTYAGSDSLAELMAAHPDTEYKVNTDNPDRKSVV